VTQKWIDPPKEKEADIWNDLRLYTIDQLVRTLQMEVNKATETAGHYVETLAISLQDITQSPELEFKGEPVQSLYSCLLDRLYGLNFEKYPKPLSENNLDAHLINIVRISSDYFTRQLVKSPPPGNSSSETGFIKVIPSPPSVPVGGNTTHQLPPRRYVLVSVSVDTVSVEGQLVVWQISVYISGQPAAAAAAADNKDPDYECLMLPHQLREKRPEVLADMGFTYDWEQEIFFHHGTEFGRRRVDLERIGLEKFTNYLDEIRSGLNGIEPNNGLILLFETGEDFALVQQLLSRHGYNNLFLDVVKGVTCLDNYLRVTRTVRPAAYTWPTYRFQVGKGGHWSASVSCGDYPPKRIEAETKPECIYRICESLLGSPPEFDNFMKWYSYPVDHSETSRMSSCLDKILELLPLQNYIERQLYTKRVPVVLEGIYAARNEVEAAHPHKACAHQTIRRLISLGFTLDVLQKGFRTKSHFEIPSIIFLHDVNEVQKLRTHRQTNEIIRIIKRYFHHRRF
jgi:predicted subunit of tRNA(5-methylaminomethyl-2-thiouridylate) methyltransferase